MSLMQNNRRQRINIPKLFFTTLSLTGAFLFLLLGNSVVADEEEIEEKQYEIEIIVFSHQHVKDEETEVWSEAPELPEIVNSAELVNSFDLLTDDEIEQLPLYYQEPDSTTDNVFNKYIRRLTKDPKYNVLTHRVWRQTVPKNSSGIPVYISSKSHEQLFQPIEEPPEIVEEQAVEGEIVTAEEIESDSDVDMNETSLMQALEEEEQMIAAMILERKALERKIQEERMREKELADITPSDPIIPFEENPIIPESTPVDLYPMGPPEHQVYGTFKLSKSRFMHMSLDFVYRDEEILSEFTVYPQLIQPEESNVDNVDNLSTETTDFDETITGINEDNSFLITPIEENVEAEVEPITGTEEEPVVGVTEQTISDTAENNASDLDSISIDEITDMDEASDIEISEEMVEQTESEISPEINTLDASIYGEAQESFLNPEKPPFLGYRLANSKRVRLSKVYYFDHPKFGVIARVVRYEPPAEEVAEVSE